MSRLPCNSPFVRLMAVFNTFQALVTESILYEHRAMANSSSSNSTTIPFTFFILITEKIFKHNYLPWRAQVMPAIRATRYEDLLLDIEKAPAKTISIQAGDSSIDKPNSKYDF
jgi:hypothetical protein